MGIEKIENLFYFNFKLVHRKSYIVCHWDPSHHSGYLNP